MNREETSTPTGPSHSCRAAAIQAVDQCADDGATEEWRLTSRHVPASLELGGTACPWPASKSIGLV